MALLLAKEDDALAATHEPAEKDPISRPVAWMWGDASGAPSTSDVPVRGLEDILRWVADCRGQDSETEELEHGVVVLREEAGPFPADGEAVLRFLRGGSGSHLPVIPGTDLERIGGDADEPDWAVVPWRDLRELREETGAAPCLPRCGEMVPRAQGRGAVRVPTEMEATRSLVCAGADASDAQVRLMASHCRFYRQGELKPDATDYFSEKGEEGRFTPYLAVCANPAKRTIAFVFQCTWWI